MTPRMQAEEAEIMTFSRKSSVYIGFGWGGYRESHRCKLGRKR
jgi:hypothetical protein